MFNRLEGIAILVFSIFTNSVQCNYTHFVIEQCPGTDVSNIRRQTEFNEISLIFYYTQWSNESLEGLQQYNIVAAYFEDKVYFAAIDCWHLSCNCSKTLTTNLGSGSPHKWPTLIVHYGRNGQLKIQYNGLFTFRNMAQFIINLMHPLERVNRREDVEKLKPLSDAIVLGSFKTARSIEYQQYLMASLKWLEHDPIRTYRFTIIFINPKKTSNDNEIEKPNLLLFRHKTNKSFTKHNGFIWNATSILRWLHEDFHTDYSQLHGYSTPITIVQKIKKEPVLAVFVNEPQHFFSYIEKYIHSEQPFTEAATACKNFKKREEQKRMKSLQISKITQKLKVFNDNTKCHYYNKDIILKNLNFYYEFNNYFKFSQQYSNSVNYDLWYKLSFELYDLLSFFQSATCLQKEDITLQTSVRTSTIKKLEGYLANEQHCKSSNRSLAVVLLDTQRYNDFLENIAISPTRQSMATVFIIDNLKENIYVMEDNFAMYNLIEFVKKFYTNDLYNYYKNVENTPAKQPLSKSSTFSYDIQLIKQLNRIIFLNYLQYAYNQTLIVLIYSPDCALCANMQHSILQLSLTMRYIDDLKFIRINTMDNDLPWQFNMPFLPALLIFPKNRFSESRLFPLHLKPDVRNVFGFILSQLSSQQQIRIVLNMCKNGTMPQSHTQSCWQFAKTILMQLTGKHLQYWQMFEADRNVIFEHLRAFKDMSLDIQRNLRL